MYGGIKVMNKIEEFEKEVEKNVNNIKNDREMKEISGKWFKKSFSNKYSYNFSWLGRPIIQYPQDIIAMQEIIWKVKPDLIIETGIAHGGSLIFYASMLELLGGERKVIGIDIDIREHNRKEIEKHKMYNRIEMIQGSSIDSKIINQVKDKAKNYKKVLVVLDSNHTHEHVLEELRAYETLVNKESYIVVFDTVVEDLPNEYFNDRPWDNENNPKTAVWEFLRENKRFEADNFIDNKLQITVAPNGYLKCIEDAEK